MSWVLLIATLACWSWESAEELRATENQIDMERHYEQATAARDAVIRGDVTGAIAALEDLRERLPAPAIPPELRPKERGLIEAVEAAEGASDLSGAAAGVAGVAAACSGCHSAAGVRLASAAEAPPEDGAMQVHYWAAARLWDGLLGADDEAIAAAFAALGDAAFVPEALGDPALRATAAPVAADLAARAAAVAAPGASQQDRIRAYADFLETCAACHQLTGGGPQPP